MRRDESRLYEGEIIKKQKKVCGRVHGIEIFCMFAVLNLFSTRAVKLS